MFSVCLSPRWGGGNPGPVHGSVWGYPLVLSMVLSGGWGSLDRTKGTPPPDRTRCSYYAMGGAPLAGM